MESANLWSQISDKNSGVRIAEQADARAITDLLRSGQFSHIHADWHYPADWLGSSSFVVVPESTGSGKKSSFTDKLFAKSQSLKGCLAVEADPPPAAWVRLAAVANRFQSQPLIATMLSSIIDVLRDSGVSQIAWLLSDDWPESWLPDLGFEKINSVITYEKTDLYGRHTDGPAGLEIRPVESADLPALAAIETRAFTPLWRHSELSLSLARQQALSFDVAWLDDKPAGFQFSSATRRGAHLSRITVEPTMQKRGVGTALLAYALEGYYRQGISTVTLNTQMDNGASQRLYERFGFRPNGERFPIWSIDLE